MKSHSLQKLLSFNTSLKLASCATLVVLADFLFFDVAVGWTLGLFGIVLLFAVRIHAAGGRNKHNVVDITALSALGLALVQIEMPSFGVTIMFGVNMVILALLPKLSQVDDVRTLVRSVLRYFIRGWARLLMDSLMIAHVKKRRQKRYGHKRSFVRHWLLPFGMSGVFVLLFAQANPIITLWLNKINFAWVMQYLSVSRIGFAVATAFGSWALIRPKFRQRTKLSTVEINTAKQFTLTALLFNERSIKTSLVLFNGLFAVQNLMDAVFLWSGASLPDGMTYARYAHQGAYPLIATALLAALFVLISLKPGSSTEAQPKIRILVFAWVGQNIFLVLSSIVRTLGYIEEYSLTYLRVAALIWMALVAMGLLLIIARIHLTKSNAWLINSNSVVLAATLYLCCFLNFGGMIAWHNVTHSREVTNNGVLLDINYLTSFVGIEAIPALRWLEHTHPENARFTEIQNARLVLDTRVEQSMNDWHRWTFREFRIAQSVGSVPALY